MRAVLERFPRLYLEALRLKRINHWSRAWVLTPGHGCVVDGFPRSANSFAFHALRASNPHLSFATHVHSPAQIVMGAKWGVPTMVLIRNPIDAVIGAVSFEIQIGNKLVTDYSDRWIARRIGSQAKRWASFYSVVSEYKDQIFFAFFDDVINDFSKVSNAFSVKFNGRVNPYDPASISENELLSESFHVGPDRDRDVIKNIVRDLIEEGIEPRLLDRCRFIYSDLGGAKQR